ncbi:hypothetical protein ACWEK5_13140 [Rhodococcus koreensis]
MSNDISTPFENVSVDYVADDTDTTETETSAPATPAAVTPIAERGNEQYRQSAAVHEIVGAPRRERYTRERQEREQDRAQRIAAAGGGEVATALRGEVGEAVLDVLRLDRIAESARKLEHRVTEERREAHAAMQLAARAEHLDAVLADGWTAAESKAKVPAILAPHLEFVDAKSHLIMPDPLADTVVKRIREQHAGKAHQRVGDVLAEVDGVILSAAREVLEKAGSAADTLTAAGIEFDDRDGVIENGTTDVLDAFKAWKRAVGTWSDVQSARRWVGVALAAGFDPRRPETLAGGDHGEAEVTAWWSQFEGSRVGVAGAHHALVWWLENKRPAPAGVRSGEKAGESK